MRNRFSSLAAKLPPPSPPSPPPQAWRLQRFSELVPKYTLPNDIELNENCFAGNKGDKSNTGTFDNDSGSGDSDGDVYT